MRKCTQLETNGTHLNSCKRKDEDRVQLLKEQLSEVPCLVSSDVHEWCNDWGTVSGSSSVKIQWR